MKNENPLKFPEGDFTHTELAQFNKETNQSVWLRFKASIKDGTLIPSGHRPPKNGRGKPSNLYKVNPDHKIPEMVPVNPVPPVEAPVNVV